MDIQKIETVVAQYNKTLPKEQIAHLTLFSALWACMARTSAQAAKMPFDIKKTRLLNDLEEGLAFMSDCPIAIDSESLADIVLMLRACVIESGIYSQEVCETLSSINMRQLILVSDENVAATNPELYLNSMVDIMRNYGFEGSCITILIGLVSLGLRSLQEPCAQAMMRAIPHQSVAEAHALSCPVCGGRPALALLFKKFERGTTGRKLACLQCGVEWEVKRNMCVHCGTQDKDKLAFRTLENDPSHRIDYCSECNNYIRTSIIENSQTPYSIDVEDCVMSAMDSFVCA